ncbi:MAG: hypothetical protein ACRDGI_07735, partial [Candidatus Limnocylindrales bacterium]
TRPSQIGRSTAQPADRPPEPPADLDTRAREIWGMVLADQAPGIILAVHWPLLRVYCEAVARYEHAAELIAGSAPLIAGACLPSS